MTSLPITYAEDEPAMTTDPDSVHPSAADAVAVSGSDVPARPTSLAPLFYLQDTRSYVGNCPLWWAEGGNGYTTDLRKAHRYTLAEAMSQHRCRGSDVPWACSEVDAIQRPTVDMQDLYKQRGIKAQIAAMEAVADPRQAQMGETK